jgi:hypothetical protein
MDAGASCEPEKTCRCSSGAQAIWAPAAVLASSRKRGSAYRARGVGRVVFCPANGGGSSAGGTVSGQGPCGYAATGYRERIRGDRRRNGEPGSGRRPGPRGAGPRHSRVITPGLIDLHGHLEFNIFAAWQPPREFVNRYAGRGSDLYTQLVREPQNRLLDALGRTRAGATVSARRRRDYLGGTAPRAGILRDEMAQPGSRDATLLAERVEGFVSQVHAACVGHREQAARAPTTPG